LPGRYSDHPAGGLSRLVRLQVVHLLSAPGGLSEDWDKPLIVVAATSARHLYKMQICEQ